MISGVVDRSSSSQVGPRERQMMLKSILAPVLSGGTLLAVGAALLSAY